MYAKFFTQGAIALSLVSGCLLQAEEPQQVPPLPPPEIVQPQPPPAKGNRMQRPNRQRPESGMMRFMTKEQQAKFKELSAKVETALAQYRENRNEENLKALKQAVAERFVVIQEFQITQAEQAIARAKERIKNKDDAAEREVTRLLQFEKGEKGPRFDQPRRPKPQISGPAKGKKDAGFAPDNRAERKVDGKRQMPQRPRLFNAEEMKKIHEQEDIILKAQSDSKEAAAAVEQIGMIYNEALKRINAEYEKTKEGDKERARLERTQKIIRQMLEKTNNPVEYANMLKDRIFRSQKMKFKPNRSPEKQ